MSLAGRGHVPQRYGLEGEQGLVRLIAHMFVLGCMWPSRDRVRFEGLVRLLGGGLLLD